MLLKGDHEASQLSYGYIIIPVGSGIGPVFALVLVQRCNLELELGGRLVFAEMTLCLATMIPLAVVDLMLGLGMGWAGVWAAMDQLWFDVSCLQGSGVSPHVRVPSPLTQ